MGYSYVSINHDMKGQEFSSRSGIIRVASAYHHEKNVANMPCEDE